MFMSILFKPIQVEALAGEVVAGAITSGGVWGAVAGGIGIGLAVGADAIADGLSNGTIDNRVERFLADVASEWEYGYNEAQVRGEIYKAELTYGDLQALGALLQEAYPEGCITAPRGDIRTFSEMSDFRIPVDQPIYITDISQHGETAVSYCLQLSYSHYRSNTYVSGPANLDLACTSISLPSGAVTGGISGSGSVCSLPTYYGDFVSAYITFVSGILTTEYTLTDEREELYNGTFTVENYPLTSAIQSQFNDRALITTTLPTYIPGEGVAADGDVVNIQDVIDSLQEIPYGMSEDDVAISIPVTGEDAGEVSKPDVRPGVIPSGDELIDEVPEAAVEGDFSNFKLPNGLMYVFPFSLPYDFYRGITLFSAAPEVPEFTYNFQIPYPKGMGSGYLVNEEVVINFGRFEKLAIISRWVTTFGFTMLLIKLSAFILKGGNS